MRKGIAYIATAALLVGAIYAPLFHLHAHAGAAPFIHAHFTEFESPEAELVVHMEARHSDGEARPIDLLIATASYFFQFDAVVSTFQAIVHRPEVRCGFVSIAAPRAHAPPDLSSRIPRSPPAAIPATV